MVSIFTMHFWSDFIMESISCSCWYCLLLILNLVFLVGVIIVIPSSKHIELKLALISEFFYCRLSFWFYNFSSDMSAGWVLMHNTEGACSDFSDIWLRSPKVCPFLYTTIALSCPVIALLVWCSYMTFCNRIKISQMERPSSV